ncbi:MAG: SDR family NAD(P)-dependent oxidoreductase [Rhodobacteraceae bacterium]|nr:SDR family NAD(P)-dependent oxidoreductase [Paracoccaceae bacterium]
MEHTKDTLPALVTGASRGLGAALALGLAERGYPVIAVARTVGGLEDLDDRIKAVGGTATLAPLDVTNDGAMQHLCRSIHDRWGGLSLWVHTALHTAPLSPAQFIDTKDWDRSTAVNVDATRRLICYVAPLLTTPDAKAVFFDDPRGGAKFFGAYGATKAAQIALAQSWAAETVRTGPQVRVLTPPPLATATRARFFPGEDRSVLTQPSDAAATLLDEIFGA